MTHAASLRVVLEPEVAAAVAAALGVESAEGPEGSRARVHQVGEGVRIEIEAATLSDLRAALHSMLRLLDAAERVARTGNTATRKG